MYRDNSLIPIETVRIAALGALAAQPMRYGDLAADVRRFTSQIVGPSLDLMGTSIALLRTEGLLAAEPGDAADGNPLLYLTEAGREVLLTLLKAGLRAPNTELNRLVIALKMRFLHLLPPPDQGEQIDLLIGLFASERERLSVLREQTDGTGRQLGLWLDYEIGELNRRIDWFRRLAEQAGTL